MGTEGELLFKKPGKDFDFRTSRKIISGQPDIPKRTMRDRILRKSRPSVNGKNVRKIINFLMFLHSQGNVLEKMSEKPVRFWSVEYVPFPVR